MDEGTDELLRLGSRIERQLDAIRIRLGIVLVVLIIPICVGFGVGLAEALIQGGTDHQTAWIIGAVVAFLLLLGALWFALSPTPPAPESADGPDAAPRREAESARSADLTAECPVCGELFEHYEALDRHRQQHHPEPW